MCSAACGPEATWASPAIEIVAAASLIQLANHFKGTQVLSRPRPKILETQGPAVDLADIKGQESAKRALEIAAAGGHNLLMVGPPGAGKSMLAARLPSILPPLAPSELLEVSMVASVAGEIEGGALTNRRPFRAPHHSASMPALVGGGLHARPGEVSGAVLEDVVRPGRQRPDIVARSGRCNAAVGPRLSPRVARCPDARRSRRRR
jgi:magnesium chelatase family protein